MCNCNNTNEGVLTTSLILGEDPDELRGALGPVGEEPRRDGALRVELVRVQELEEIVHVLGTNIIHHTNNQLR